MSDKERRIESGADASIGTMRRRNRQAAQPLLKVLFLTILLCTMAAIGFPLVWIIPLLGFAPNQDEGFLIAGAVAIVAVGAAIILTERVESALRRWFFL
ncbi:hypothetical protein [Dongia sp.]|uniref:hypothetical protein n=1 Tax=Dongia sp. TaxID=1977262 RepID=UPI0037535DFA